MKSGGVAGQTRPLEEGWRDQTGRAAPLVGASFLFDRQEHLDRSLSVRMLSVDLHQLSLSDLQLAGGDLADVDPVMGHAEDAAGVFGQDLSDHRGRER